MLVARLRIPFRQSLATSVLFSSAVAEKISVFRVGYVVTAVADPGADGANSNAVHHFTSVAVVPMLIHEFFLGDCESAKFIA